MDPNNAGKIDFELRTHKVPDIMRTRNQACVNIPVLNPFEEKRFVTGS